MNDSVWFKGIEDFFFKAMLQGWVSSRGVEATNIPALPGYEALVCEGKDDGFRLVDAYCSGTFASAGTTTIWYRDLPVWFMSYQGRYEKKALPFLKSVLRKTYAQKMFCGGRGEKLTIDDSGKLSYRNIFEGTVEKFSGREEIVDLESHVILGYHEYRGMSLA